MNSVTPMESRPADMSEESLARAVPTNLLATRQISAVGRFGLGKNSKFFFFRFNLGLSEEINRFLMELTPSKQRHETLFSFGTDTPDPRKKSHEPQIMSKRVQAIPSSNSLEAWKPRVEAHEKLLNGKTTVPRSSRIVSVDFMF